MTREKKYRYCLEDDTLEDGNEFESDYDDLLDIAEDAAEYEHDNCDGWESNWPLVFIIGDLDNEELGRFEVEREAVPSFHASLVKEELSDG